MEERLFYLLNQAQSQLLKAADRECMEATGIPVVQNTALLVLEKNDGCTLSSLGKVLKVNKSSLGALAERMVRNKIVVKKVDPEDARIVRVYMTKVGRKKLDILKPLLADQNRRLREGFSDEEVTTVIRFLNSIVEKTTLK